MRPILGNFPFDLDSPLKESVFDGGTSDLEKVEMMREDSELTDKVLGEVWSDAQNLMKKCVNESIPAIAVFSGLGMHIHILFKERVSPTEEKVSTTQWLIDECDLSTHDRKIITDTRRILRVPNSRRISGGEFAGVWCIPMTEREVINNNVYDMLERCSRPKDISMKDRYKTENLPEMQVYEDYKEIEEGSASGTVPLEEPSVTDLDPTTEELVKDCIPMPCVRERFFSPNPDHLIRFTGTALLYQSGFNPKEVQQLISQIGWIDYDPTITEKMTNQIWNNRYSELPCKKIQSLGLCVFGPEFQERSDDPKDCETHKWSSGKAIYG
jgi:hypothetical protein